MINMRNEDSLLSEESKKNEAIVFFLVLAFVACLAPTTVEQQQ
jgi:hypothetical protein